MNYYWSYEVSWKSETFKFKLESLMDRESIVKCSFFFFSKQNKYILIKYVGILYLLQIKLLKKCHCTYEMWFDLGLLPGWCRAVNFPAVCFGFCKCWCPVLSLVNAPGCISRESTGFNPSFLWKLLINMIVLCCKFWVSFVDETFCLISTYMEHQPVSVYFFIKNC